MKLTTRCGVMLAITALIGTTLLGEPGGTISSLAESDSILGDAYGTASVTSHTIQAWDFETRFQTDTYLNTTAYARYQTGSSTGQWTASVACTGRIESSVRGHGSAADVEHQRTSEKRS